MGADGQRKLLSTDAIILKHGRRRKAFGMAVSKTTVKAVAVW